MGTAATFSPRTFFNGATADAQYKPPSLLSDPDSSSIFSFSISFSQRKFSCFQSAYLPHSPSPPGQLETDQRKLLPSFTNSCFISIFLDNVPYHFKGPGQVRALLKKKKRWASRLSWPASISHSWILEEQFQCYLVSPLKTERYSPGLLSCWVSKMWVWHLGPHLWLSAFALSDSKITKQKSKKQKTRLLLIVRYYYFWCFYYIDKQKSSLFIQEFWKLHFFPLGQNAFIPGVLEVAYIAHPCSSLSLWIISFNHSKLSLVQFLLLVWSEVFFPTFYFEAEDPYI